MKKLLFALIFLFPFLSFSQIVVDDIELYDQYNGYVNFTALGNTMNASPNPCSLLASSSADLNLLPTETILSAHLYWSGPWPSLTGGDYDVSLNGMPVTASRDFHLRAATNNTYFSAYADVTDIVLATGNGTYTFADLFIDLPATGACNNGTDFAGWAIYVIYEDPVVPLTQISLFDGLDFVSGGNPQIDIQLTGLDVSSDNFSKIGFLAWEGDASIANGEALFINGTLIDNPPLNPGNNAFNGTNSYTNSNTLYNMDLDYYDLNGLITIGDTTIDITLQSQQDFVMVNNIITAVNSELPDATITIDGTAVVCENDQNMNVDYTVFNVNSTDILPAATPIAFYIDGVLAGQSQTVNDIPIDGSESGSIILTIPLGTPPIFNLLLVVDDIGNGTGIVNEIDETNNEAIEQIDLLNPVELLGPDIEGCVGTPITLDTGISNPDFTWQWYRNGVLIPGATDSTLVVTTDGTYAVVGSEGPCQITDEIEVHFNPQPIANEPDNLYQCNDGVNPGIYDLTLNDPVIMGAQDPALFVIKYYETFLDSENDTNEIVNPTNYAMTPPPPQIIYARIEGQLGICYDLTQFELRFPMAIPGVVPGPFEVCDQDQTGDEPVDLAFEFDNFVLNGEPATFYDITYHANQTDADADINPLPTPYFVPVPGQTIYIRLENIRFSPTYTCYNTTTVDIIVHEIPLPNPNPDPLILCDDDNDGFLEFDLSMADDNLTGGDPDLVVSYHGTMLDAENGILPIGPLYTNDDPWNDNVWARIESISSSCYAVVELFLEVRYSPVATEPSGPLRLCDDAVADGFTSFDLTVVAAEVLGSLDPLEFDLYYYEDELDAIAAGDVALTAPDFSLAIPDPTDYINTSNPQTIYILVVGNGNSVSPNNGASGCYDIVPLELIVDPLPPNLGPFEMYLCDDELNGSTPTDEISTFDLTLQDPAITGGDPDLVVTWYATPGDEVADNPIPDPTMYQNTVTPETVVARIESQYGCRTVVTMTLTVLPNPTPNMSPAPIELCDNEDTTGDFDNGLSSGFDLTQRDAEIIDGDPDVSILYYETLADAQAGLPGTELVSPYTNIVPDSQIVYARVERDVPPAILACYTVVELELIVIALPDAPTEEFLDPMFECDDDGDGEALFDLTQNDPYVLGVQDPNDFVLPITYYTSLADAEAPMNSITPADAFLSTGQTIWVRLESLVTGCVRISSFELEVGVFPTIGTGDDLYLCDDELNGSTSTDGLSTFDLTQNTPLIDLGNPDLTVIYYATLDDQNNDVPIVDPSSYQNSISPQQEIFVTVLSSESCGALTSFFINVEPNPSPPDPITPLVACDEDNDGFYDNFMLTDKDVEIQNGQPVSVVYYGSLLDAQTADPADQLLSPYTNIVPFSQIIYARVTNDVPPGVNACYTIVALELRVELLPSAPDASTFIDPMSLCDDDGDGFAQFNLEANTSSALAGNDPTLYGVSYHESLDDAQMGVNAIANPSTYVNIVTPEQSVWVRVEDLSTGCARVTEFTLRVDPLPVLAPGPFEMVECDDTEGDSTFNDQISTFDLTLNDDAITQGNANWSVFYYTSLDNQNNNAPIEDPTAYQNKDLDTDLAINPQDIYVSVFTEAECESRTNITLRVLPNPSPTTPTALRMCDGSGGAPDDEDYRDGISIFDLTLKDSEIRDGEPNINIFYYETLEAAEAGVAGTELISPYLNTVPNNQVVYARVTKDVPPGELPCYTIVPLELVVDPLPEDSFEISDVENCQVPFTGQAFIFLNTKDAEILSFQDPDHTYEVSYYETLSDAQASTNSIASDIPYPYNTVATTIYVGLLNNDTQCYIASIEDPDTEEVSLSFDLIVKEGATASEPSVYAICDNRDPSDGYGDFTLIVDPLNETDLDAQAAALAQEILNGQDPSQFTLTYHGNELDAELGINPLPDVYTNIVNPQEIYARVTNTIDPEDDRACYAVTPVILKVEQLPPFLLEESYRLCVDGNGNPIEEESGAASPPLLDTGLDAQFYTFVWSFDGQILPNDIGPSLLALSGGSYSVLVTELSTGCQAEATTTVVISSPPLVYSAEVTSDAFANEHTVTVTVDQGSGDWVYQLDGGPFQDSDTFTGIDPGTHTITISDVNGCGSVTIEVGVVDYPQYMTPNGDGYHDTWNIIGIAQYDPTAKIYIFDRYGKLLKQISPSGEGWDGTYNGSPLPSSDYWFRVEYTEDETNKTFTGHFSLKR